MIGLLVYITIVMRFLICKTLCFYKRYLKKLVHDIHKNQSHSMAKGFLDSCHLKKHALSCHALIHRTDLRKSPHKGYV